ncbi:alpha-ketoglutarate-dependent dioxygenase AlkB [Caenimonas terrae]|uniref:Alpha-ketoglutarate-dependent dioxygenase AlkB n=1 Tax=Caenimonas terrae TaxID=696074 RepID=A0ABW0NB34_9BURK
MGREQDRQAQASLFEQPPPQAPALPPGMVYQPDFLSAGEERLLLALIEGWPLEAMRYKAYTARRRVLSFGGKYDFDANRLREGLPIPAQLQPLRAKVAGWLGLAPQEFTQVLVAQYSAGTPLGWHRDVPDFEDVVGVSLLGEAVLRFRPWPHQVGKRAEVLKLAVAPRSIYLLRGAARWAWQHSVAPTGALRYSVTFRTAGRRA